MDICFILRLHTICPLKRKDKKHKKKHKKDKKRKKDYKEEDEEAKSLDQVVKGESDDNVI